jgi:hypothetical protein
MGISAGVISRILVDTNILPPLIPIFIKKEMISSFGWGIIISTIFLIIDHVIIYRKKIITYIINQIVEGI